jgi:acetyl-CoA carboxylase biotin carboxyl carrier protein
MGLTDDDVREILRIIDESELDELRIDMPGFRLHVRRGGAPPPEPAESPPAPVPAEREPAPPAGSPPEPEPEPAAASPNGAATIDAPMLGTFYRASAPGEQPFVDVGSQVDPDTVVCLIEVMKMMNSVKAGVSGTVVEVCATNAELVEYGEPLFRVDPAA